MANRNTDRVWWSFTFLCITICEAKNDGAANGAWPVSTDATSNNSSTSPVCRTSSCNSTAENVIASMNDSVDPCDNFYQYACGGWIARHPIPSNESSIDQFWLLNEKMKPTRQNLLEDQPNNHSNFDAARKARSLYKQCKERDAIERLRSQPLLDILNKTLGGWPVLTPKWQADKFDLFKIVTALTIYGIDSFLSTTVMQDAENPKSNRLSIDQCSFPSSRDVYESEAGPLYKESYRLYIRSVTQLLLQDSRSQRDADDVMPDLQLILDLEENLTRSQLAGVDYRDSLRYKTLTTFSDVQKQFIFRSQVIRNLVHYTREIFSAVQLEKHMNNDTVFNLAGPDYMVKLDEKLYQLEQLGLTGKRILANFVGWRVFTGYQNRLSKDYRDAYQEHQQRTMGQATKQDAPIPELCADDVISSMTLAVSTIYVQTLPNSLKDSVSAMTKDIQAGVTQLIQESKWMDEETSIQAMLKLKNMMGLMGYPSLLRDNICAVNEELKDVRIYPTYFTTLRELDKRSIKKNLKKLTQHNKRIDPIDDPFDLTEVNAFYDPYKNIIAVMAATLQVPFFVEGNPAPFNYGGIGWFIGHETTHAFDDQGSHFDEVGKMKNWWSNQTRKDFTARLHTLIDQYGNYSYAGIGSIDGALTIGENIADNGGLKAAYRGFSAYQRRQTSLPLKLKGLKKFTDDQLFFISAGQAFCNSIRPEALRLALTSDEHSPSEFRVIGTMSNMPEFAQAFNCSIGSPMNPVKKNGVW